MRYNLILTGLLTLLLLQKSLSQQYMIPMSVFVSGGGSAGSTSNNVVSTLGQPFIGTVGSASNKIAVGFWYIKSNLITLVEKSSDELPTEYRLEQNYPNPFNSSTVINFALPEESHVSIKIYNVLGEEVTTIVEGVLLPGFHKVHWSPINLASGVYFYRMVAKSVRSAWMFTGVKKIVYLK